MCSWAFAVATQVNPARTASSAMASLRTESSGSPWSHSSTATRSRPNSPTRRCSSFIAAAGPCSTKAEGTVPFRHPVSTHQ